MKREIVSETLYVEGMTCAGCESRIHGKLSGMKGVESAAVNYNRATVDVRYDPGLVSREEIIHAIEKMNYQVKSSPNRSGIGANGAVGLLLILFAAYLLLRRAGLLQVFSAFPQAEAGMGYGVLFGIGLLTSVHCVAMCGGINLSQCISAGGSPCKKEAALRPSALYNVGRILSYTATGGVVGALGSVISFSGTAQGVIQLAAGLFMVLMGVNLLGIFPWLRRFTPRLPRSLAGRLQGERNNSPLVVGLLNGLMPCGPLQAMQVYALSTGSPFKGALSMFLFGLGTVPLMFGLGALSSVLSRKFTKKVMTAGALLVVLLGISMFQSGLALSGFAASAGGDAGDAAQVQDGVQVIATQLSPGRYEPITVQAGVPVEWTITAQPGTVNGCNNRIIIREYGVEKQLEVGDNVIVFTPTRSGTFPYSCWMGMIRSTITVTGDGDEPADPSAGDAAGEYAPRLSQPQLAATVPADALAVAEVLDDSSQRVAIDMADTRFSPAVIVLQYGLETEWIVNRREDSPGLLNVPAYNAQMQLLGGENKISLLPESSFYFSADNNAFYGYVKVVEDIDDVDIDAVLQEAGALRIAADTAESDALPSCCAA